MNYDHAGALRRRMTDAERALWRCLREHRSVLGKFRRQQPIGDYVVDFVNFDANLIIEADGGQHNDSASDVLRDAWLRTQGFRVLRFWDNEVLVSTDSVLEKIIEEIRRMVPLSPVPSPTRGEGRTAATRPKVDEDIDRHLHRPIRSYVLRQGRITDAQRRALETLWPRYGITLGDAPLDLDGLFGRAAPVVLEIGFGNGDALAAFAQQHPEQNFLGVEVHRPGVGSLLRKVADGELDNVRVVVADANEVLARLAPASLHGVHVFFPDPWPKKRHHKRRLLQPEFAAKLRRNLAPGGYLHCATDWEPYAAQMLSVLEATPGLINAAGAGRYTERPATRPATRFENRGRAAGRAVRDLLFRRNAEESLDR